MENLTYGIINQVTESQRKPKIQEESQLQGRAIALELGNKGKRLQLSKHIGLQLGVPLSWNIDLLEGC